MYVLTYYVLQTGFYMMSALIVWNDLSTISRVLIISSVRKQKDKSQNGVLFYTSENKEKKQESLFAWYLQKQRVEVFWKKVAHSL